MFRRVSNNGKLPDGVKGFVLGGGLPAALRLAPCLSFTISSMTNCQVRVAICGVAGRQIRAGDLQIHGGLLFGFFAANGTCRSAVARSVVCKLSCLPVTSS